MRNMYINFNSLQTKAFYIKEKLFSSLTPRQKNILVVAALALGCIAAIYLFCKCCFKANTINKEHRLASSKKKISDEILEDANESPLILPTGSPKTPIHGPLSDENLILNYYLLKGIKEKIAADKGNAVDVPWTVIWNKEDKREEKILGFIGRVNSFYELARQLTNHLAEIKAINNDDQVLPIEDADLSIQITEDAFHRFSNPDEKEDFVKSVEDEILSLFAALEESMERLGYEIKEINQSTFLSGIKNPKNDCFYIAMLQILSVPEFDPIFEKLEGDDDDSFAFIKKIQKLREQVNKPSEKVLAALDKEFREAMGLGKATQEDVTDLFNKLIDYLEESNPKRKELIQKLIKFQQIEEKTILEGDQIIENEKAEEFSIFPGGKLQRISEGHTLLPDIQCQNISDWLKGQEMGIEEDLELKYRLDTSPQKVRKATRIHTKTEFKVLPKLLSIAPKRRQFGKTVHDEYQMPPVIKLTNEAGEEKKYVLIAFALHRYTFYSSVWVALMNVFSGMGADAGGHYITYRLHQGCWFECNDSRIENLTGNEIGTVPLKIIEARSKGYFYLYKETNNF